MEENLRNNAILRVGVTGSNGFIGGHLTNKLRLYSNQFAIVEFNRDWFHEDDALDQFVRQCDVIVHLAALNRHEDQEVLHDTNIELVRQLVGALDRTLSRAHVLISSSSQEEYDNIYGRSKRSGRQMLVDWAVRSGGLCTGLVIPNVFGPFGKPFYNSVIATFCYQLTHGEVPSILVDKELHLIYVDELTDFIVDSIHGKRSDPYLEVPHSYSCLVSEILSKLVVFSRSYFEKGVFPKLDGRFDIQLFNTFRSYIELETFFPRQYQVHSDNRGAFTELVRVEVGGQFSFSTTKPGITRGNHFHTRKIERFSVISGEALIQMRRVGTSEILDFRLSGQQPAYVDMPVWYTHNITNIGEDVLYTCFWINEPYDESDPDTYYENV